MKRRSCAFSRGRKRTRGQRRVPRVQGSRRHSVSLAGEVRRNGTQRAAPTARTGGGEPALAGDCGPASDRYCSVEGCGHKKMVSASDQRQVVQHLVEAHPISQRRACALVTASRSTVRYTPRETADEAPLVAAVCTLAEQHPVYGYRPITALVTLRAIMAHPRVWCITGDGVPAGATGRIWLARTSCA